MSIRYDQIEVGMTLYRKAKRVPTRLGATAYEAVKVLSKDDLACQVVIENHTRTTLRRDEIQSLYRQLPKPKKPAPAPRATAHRALRPLTPAPRGRATMTSTAAPPRSLAHNLALGAALFGASLLVGIALASLVRHLRAPPAPPRPAVSAVGTTASLPAVAAVLNAGLPRKVAVDVRLDRVIAGDRQMAMEYTLLEIPAHAATQSDLDRAFKAQLTTSYCEDPASRVIREGGISVAHRYRGNDDKDIGSITVGPLDCTL